ncbi:MAG TPA: DUF6166 domain-containing protein [Longimicrobium sp.]|nr:DUF6166 domain-containing protein [Longimicrobium sp.]
MDPSALLQPAEYVWLPLADAGRPEPPPAGAGEILAVYLGRQAGPDHAARTVLVETRAGFAPLPRRIHLHGDVDEGWDWGWRGSAPLNTALNLLACFVHPRAAWRLQWAFCEAFLHPLPAAGGTLSGERVRMWLREHAWIGRGEAWAGDAAERALLADEGARSRLLTPQARAERVAELLAPALAADGGARGAREGAGTGVSSPELAAAVLAGAPAEQRWATLAMLAGHLPRPGTPAREAWHRLASPRTPGLPDPDTVATVAGVWSRLVGRPAAARAALLAQAIRQHAAGGATAWDGVPHLALPLGAGFPAAARGEPHLAGDPAAAAATLHALRAAVRGDRALADAAAALGLTADVLGELTRSAHRLHAATLRDERRAVERDAADEAERVHAAEAVRLPRGRSQPPPPHSDALRRWVLAVSEELLVELARAARGPGGPLVLRAALDAAGTVFPDPPGTVAQAITWYLEERAPRLLDLPSFLVRGDGLFRTPAAGDPGRTPPGAGPEHALRSFPGGRAPRAA